MSPNTSPVRDGFVAGQISQTEADNVRNDDIMDVAKNVEMKVYQDDKAFEKSEEKESEEEKDDVSADEQDDVGL